MIPEKNPTMFIVEHTWETLNHENIFYMTTEELEESHEYLIEQGLSHDNTTMGALIRVCMEKRGVLDEDG